MRGLMVVAMCAFLAAPALGARYRTYDFTIDQSMSYMEFGFYGAMSMYYGSSPIAGNFQMRYDSDAVPNWESTCIAMHDIDAWNTNTFSFGFGPLSGKIWPGYSGMPIPGYPGGMRLLGFDKDRNEGTGPADNVHYTESTTVNWTEVYVEGEGYMPALSPPYFTLSEWVGPMPWLIHAAMDNGLGVPTPGNVETTLQTRGLYPIQPGVYLDVIIVLAGAGDIVPEPGTLSLLALSGLALIRRRRA